MICCAVSSVLKGKNLSLVPSVVQVEFRRCVNRCVRFAPCLIVGIRVDCLLSGVVQWDSVSLRLFHLLTESSVNNLSRATLDDWTQKQAPGKHNKQINNRRIEQND